jgi:hypothetical protein
MNKFIITDSTIQNIATKIKNITGQGNKIKGTNIAEEIRNITPLNIEDYMIDGECPSSNSGSPGILKAFKKIPWITSFDKYEKTTSSLFKDWVNIEETPPITLTTQDSVASMFSGCTSLKKVNKITIPLSVNASYMFNNCHNLNDVCLDIKGTLKSASYMFYDCTSLKEIQGLDGIKVLDASYMFHNCTSLLSIPQIDLSEVTKTEYMFHGCPLITKTIDIPPTVTNTAAMYQGCSNLTEITDFDKTSISSMYRMFQDCTSLTYAPEMVFPSSYGAESLFQGCTALTKVEGIELAQETYYYSHMFSGCSSLKEIGFYRRPLVQRTSSTTSNTLFNGGSKSSIERIGEIDCRSMRNATVWMESCTALEYIGKMNLEACTNAYAMLRGCTSLKEIGELYMPNIQEMGELFRRCNSLEKAPTIDLTNARILEEMFYECTKLIEVTFTGDPKNVTDVTNMFYNVKTEGTLIYDGRYDYSKIINAIPSTWTAKSSYTPTECVELTIVGDNVTARRTTTTIYWTAITNGINEITGEEEKNIIIQGKAISEPFEQNTSYDEVAIREISFTYMGVTATTTIEQSVWIDRYYDINLNNQWRLSQDVSNPDSALYDGVYESYSNRGIHGAGASAFITITGYDNFKFYIRSNAESSCDYVMVGNLDQTLTNSTSTSSVKTHTSGNQQSGTNLSSYKLVEFTDIDEGEHTIQVIYRKDGSADRGTDSGYILIPYEQ